MSLWHARRFSRKVAVAFSFTTLVAVVLTGTLVGRSFSQSMRIELFRALSTQTAIIESQIDARLFARKDSAALHALAHHLDKISGCRITFIGMDGVVLGDSALTTDRLKTVENHLGRPEVREALQLGEGRATRLSATVHENFLYTAIAVEREGKKLGIVRLAYPLTEIQKQQRNIRMHIVALSLAALLLTILMAFWVSRTLSRPVAEMSRVAEELADGRFDRRVPETGPDEHGRLGRTLNLLASRIQSTIQELEQEKSQLVAILSNMDEAVVAVDAAGRIIAVNPALSRAFAVPPDQAENKVFLEVIRQSQINQLIQDVLRELAPRTAEVRAFAPDERIFEAHAAPLIREEKASGALIVLHDITRLRRLEQVRRDFVANVSHELRTPLASVMGFAETLRLGALEDPKVAKEFVESIEKQAKNMTALVEDLLDLTAVESGQRAPAPEPVQMTEVVADVVSALKSVADRRKIKLENAISPSAPAVLADRGHLKQIVSNLVDNAIKFNGDGGWVRLTSSSSDGHFELHVSDSGIGIPAQDLPRIFERFYRVDKARSRSLGGTGLGLSIVKHLAEANGGTASVESTIGKGSTFTVTLPLA